MRKIHYTDIICWKPHHPVTVFIIGAEERGFTADHQPARMGHCVASIRIFVARSPLDPGDTVTQANIGRQLFSETELGTNSGDSAAVTRVNRFSAWHGWRKAAVGPAGTSKVR